ncbi:MAG TPA: hypothetical protein VFL64_02095, partial [Rhizobacter sp.]|nr:hypothetical protein [Rhizobacter sp.]
MPIARFVVRQQRSRTHDKFGSGQYGARRDGGTRTHRGLDVVTTPREAVFSPIDGTVVREARPYPGDRLMRGLVIHGRGEWTGYRVKIFYAEGLVCGDVQAGQPIALAQDLSLKYPGITNHIHLELSRDG